jgi:hypothetical protein
VFWTQTYYKGCALNLQGLITQLSHQGKAEKP